jgi:hypothetical protein
MTLPSDTQVSSMPSVGRSRSKRSLRRKEDRVREAMRRHSPAYARDLTWSAALQFIFPELASRISR